MRYVAALILVLPACGGPLPASHFAGLYEADVETTVTAAGRSPSKSTDSGKMTLSTVSTTELRLEDATCPVSFVFDRMDDVGFYHFHAVPTTCSSADGGKTTNITSGWILVETEGAAAMPAVEIEGTTRGTEELSFTVFRRATKKL